MAALQADNNSNITNLLKQILADKQWEDRGQVSGNSVTRYYDLILLLFLYIL